VFVCSFWWRVCCCFCLLLPLVCRVRFAKPMSLKHATNRTATPLPPNLLNPLNPKKPNNHRRRRLTPKNTQKKPNKQPPPPNSGSSSTARTS
jgi:hypothetical protein